MRIFKIVFMVSVLCIFGSKYLFSAPYRVMGDFTLDDKAKSDTLKTKLEGLSPITDPEKLEVVQEVTKGETGLEERVLLDIVFKDDAEGRIYFEELKKERSAGEVSIHLCTNSEYTGAPNVSCVLDEKVILTKP